MCIGLRLLQLAVVSCSLRLAAKPAKPTCVISHGIYQHYIILSHIFAVHQLDRSQCSTIMVQHSASYYCARHFRRSHARARHMRGRICFSHASGENVVVVVLFCLCLWHATALHTTSMGRSNPVQAIFIRQGRTVTLLDSVAINFLIP